MIDYSGLPNPMAPALAFEQGLARGRADTEERAVRGALSAYAMNPGDPGAFRTLAQYRPEFAIQIREDQSKREREAAVADLQRRAASGDRSALAELAGIDLNAFDKLADNDRAQVHARVEAIGNAALDIASRPLEQRPAAWDAYVDQLSRQYPELAELKGRYSEEALRAAIADVGKTQDFLRSQQPDYQAIPEGGTLVNVRDPAAVQSFMGGLGQAQVAHVRVNTPEEAAALPPGTKFLDPNGVERIVPGGGGGNATGGFRP